MADANFPKILNAFIVITLFSLLLLGFLGGLGSNYGKDATDINDRIGSTKINQTLESAQSTAEGWQNRFTGIGEGNIFSDLLDVVGLLSVGMFNLVTGMIDFLIIPFEVISNILNNVLGVPPIVTNIINVLIILGTLFGIWSLIKRGV